MHVFIFENIFLSSITVAFDVFAGALCWSFIDETFVVVFTSYSVAKFSNFVTRLATFQKPCVHFFFFRKVNK